MAVEYLKQTVIDNPYIPNELHGHAFPSERQALFLATPCPEILFGGQVGGGKALCVKTPIATPIGWKAMGDLIAGDWIFDDKGNQVQVAIAHPYEMRESYRVEFDDGSEIIASAEHLWKTLTAKDFSQLIRCKPEWRKRRRDNRPSRVSGKKSDKFAKSLSARNSARAAAAKIVVPAGSVRDTAEIARTLRTEKRNNHAVPVIERGLKTFSSSLPIDPYVLGCWLGDGSSVGGSNYTCHVNDSQIIEEIRKAGWAVKKSGPKYSWQIGSNGRYRIANRRVINTFTEKLRNVGLVSNKHVPLIYLRASRHQRLALLQGLMDTDGCAYKNGSVEFCNTNRLLAEAVEELAASLGHKAKIRVGWAKIYGRTIGEKYTLRWTPPEPVFRLKRKLELQNPKPRQTTRFRYIVACDPIGLQLVRCITVANKNGMFLCGKSMIPTHNSSGLLAGALQFATVPGYSAIIFRRTLVDLEMAGGLIEMSHEWLSDTEAEWDGGGLRWHFPTVGESATLTFAYLKEKNDHLKYKGFPFQAVFFDELTSFPREDQYRFLFSRLRKPLGMNIPLRMRATTNPGDVGAEWVKKRFIKSGNCAERMFIPSRLEDNPGIDREAYEKTLAKLDPVTYAQMRKGDWDIKPEGQMFKREWFAPIIEPRDVPPLLRICRGWDMAASVPSDEYPDPDYTAGVKMGIDAKGDCYVLHVDYGQWDAATAEEKVAANASIDGRSVAIRIEQEPGSAGKAQVSLFERRILMGYDCKGEPATGDKITRLKPMSAAASRRQVKLVRGDWNSEFVDSCASFPSKGVHDDIPDAAEKAFRELTTGGVALETGFFTASR